MWTDLESVYTVGAGCLSGGKAAGAWPSASIPSSAEVKKRIELYL